MNCRKVTEKLMAFRDGELPEDEIQILREHLHMCPPCIDLFDGYEEVVEVLNRLRPVNMPADFLKRMKDQLCEEPGKE